MQCARRAGARDGPRHDKPVVVDVWRVKSNPASVGLVTDDFGALEFTFDVLKDTTKVGAGVSQYFKINQVE